MAEELRNASYSLPRAMIATMFVNGSMGFVMLVTFCILVGNVEVLATETTQPFIQVFYNVNGSKAGATAMTCIMIIMSTFGCVTSIATSSRQVWAFARDHGLPFSTWLAHVSARSGPSHDTPVAKMCAGPSWMGYTTEQRYGMSVCLRENCISH